MNSAIIQWNMASYYSNFEELKVLIRDQCNPQVFCLQETRHGTKTIMPPSGYNCIQSHPINNEPSARGVCLLINKSINYKTLPLKISGNVEAVAARVYGLTNIIVYAQYTYLPASLYKKRISQKS